MTHCALSRFGGWVAQDPLVANELFRSSRFMSNRPQRRTGQKDRPNRPRYCVSIPTDLQEHVRRVSAATDIPQSRIVEQGIRIRLAEIEAGKVRAA